MATIFDDLRQIARVCKSAEEFTDRAHGFLNDIVKQPICTDAELRKLYTQEQRFLDEKQAWSVYDETITPALNKRADCKELWYEVWIDLEETWLDKWFASFRFMDVKEVVEVCAKYLNERERFYDSPLYIDVLNEMIKDIKFEEND